MRSFCSAGLSGALGAMIVAGVLSFAPGAPGAAVISAATPPPDVRALPLTQVWSTNVDGLAPRASALSSIAVVAGWADHLATYALDDGRLLGTLAVPAERLACAGTTCLVSGAGALTAVDVSTPRVVWQRALAADAAWAPTLRAGWALVAGADGSVSAFRAADGVLVWHARVPNGLAAPPAIDGDIVALVTAAGVNSELTLLDIRSGAARATVQLGVAPTSVAVAATDVLVGTDARTVLVIDTRTGTLRFPPLRTAANIVGPPLVDEAHIYTSGLDGVLRAFDRINGAQRWYNNLATRGAGRPVVSGALIVVPLGSGAFDVRTHDGKTVTTIDAPSTAQALRLPTPPIADATDGVLRTVALSYDFNDQSHWSMVAYATAAPLATAPLPATLPGTSVEITAPLLELPRLR